nr:PAS domain-containing protein [Sneathiella limimaris]
MEPTITLYNWWSSFSPQIPTREQFDISQVPSIAANIYLIERFNPGHYDYRLCGDLVGDLIGRHYREHPIMLNSPAFEDQILAEYLDMISTDKTAYKCTGDLSFVDRQYIQFESVDCPLVNSKGEITHFVGALGQKS